MELVEGESLADRLQKGPLPLDQVVKFGAQRAETQHHWPSFLLDGRHFLYLARGPQPARNAIFVGSLDGSEVQQLLSADSPAVHAPPGYLL
jgi:hypothetical protein